MKYQLKDPDTRAILNNIRAFENRFQDACKDAFEDHRYGSVRVYIDDDVVVEVPRSAIESLEYRPDQWNKFPEIEPPECEEMRCERQDGDRTARFCARYQNGIWWSEDGNSHVTTPDRFRPWYD